MLTIQVCENSLLRRFGRQGAPKLLCIHGFSDCGQMFEPLIDTSLADSFEIIAVDLPGFGASPRQAGVGTIHEHAWVVSRIAAEISGNEPIGLVGHSIAAAIAVATCEKLPVPPLGLFSIEGNLTQEDAFFTGKAADWEDPQEFRVAFLNEIWELASKRKELLRYFGAAVQANATSMWELGRDAKRVSEHNAVGASYARLNLPTLYYWSQDSTPATTRQFIRDCGIFNTQFSDASHWPTVDDPVGTASAIHGFFSRPR